MCPVYVFLFAECVLCMYLWVWMFLCTCVLVWLCACVAVCLCACVCLCVCLYLAPVLVLTCIRCCCCALQVTAPFPPTRAPQAGSQTRTLKSLTLWLRYVLLPEALSFFLGWQDTTHTHTHTLSLSLDLFLVLPFSFASLRTAGPRPRRGYRVCRGQHVQCAARLLSPACCAPGANRAAHHTRRFCQDIAPPARKDGAEPQHAGPLRLPHKQSRRQRQHQRTHKRLHPKLPHSQGQRVQRCAEARVAVWRPPSTSAPLTHTRVAAQHTPPA